VSPAPAAGPRGSILFLSRWFPYPPANGSKLRVFNLLRILATEYEVTLVSFAEPHESVDVDAPALRGVCRETHFVRRTPFDANRLRARLAFFSPRPRSVVDTWSEEFAGQVRGVLAARYYDAVIVSQIDTAAYASCFDGYPALFEEIELGLMYAGHAGTAEASRRLRHSLTRSKHRRYLAGLLRHFAACTVASNEERRLVEQVAPGGPAIEIIPNGVHLPDYAGVNVQPEPGHLIFTGAFTYHANYDAASWFLSDIYPRIKAARPDTRFTITGDHADLPLPPAPGVTLTGFVQDVRQLIAGAWASVAPMRQGGGTRLKILEAMALGTPVIATSKGAEGLDMIPGRHLLVADDPSTFADATVRLLGDASLRQSLADEAARLVAARYDWQVIAPRFLRLVDGVIRSRAPAAQRFPDATGSAIEEPTP
jgi:glycosyltransferase involved in cell wall biosynthesis